MLPEDVYNEMWTIFQNLGITALAMNHYDLAAETSIDDPQLWKKFLIEPEVAEWIRTEVNLIQDSELKKMIQNINTSKSVGQAQLMNALVKLGDNKGIKEGPIFIYTYVPLSEEQKQAENIEYLTFDPFLKKGQGD